MACAERTFAEVLAAWRRDPFSLVGRIPGLWLVNKPPGPSSARVVERARRSLGIKKLGHAGTLDPMAGGLLILMAGHATRLFDQLQEFPKVYRAGFRLGDFHELLRAGADFGARRRDPTDRTTFQRQHRPRLRPGGARGG